MWLIAAILGADELAMLIRETGDFGLDALVEVHDEAELDEALEAGAVSGDMYLLVAEGDEITRNQEGSWVIDGSVTVVVRAPDNVQPIVRTSQGVRQLLLPVGITTNQAVLIELEISW